MFANQLKTDRQWLMTCDARHVACRLFHWYRNSGEASKIDWNGKYVRKVHRQWVAGFFSEFECRRWRDRSKNNIYFFECFIKIFFDQRARLLRFGIVSIVISG